MHQSLERLFGPLAAMDAGRTKNTTVSWMFCALNPAERFEIFRQNSQRTGFFTFEELRIQYASGCIPRLSRDNTSIAKPQP